MLAKDQTFKLGSLKREDGVSTKTPNKTLNLIMETHFPGSISCADSNSSGRIEYERCSVETLSPDKTVISEQKKKKKRDMPQKFNPIDAVA